MTGLIPIITAVIGFAVTAAMGIFFIPFLKKIHFGQTILDIGPKWHKSKEGTPIMGGFMFMIGTFLALCIGFFLASVMPGGQQIIGEMASKDRLCQLIAGLVMALLMAGIGFMDDYIKAVKKQNLGLKASQKTFLQLLVAAGYLLTMLLSGMKYTFLPFIGRVDLTSGLGLLFWPIALVFIYGFTNAVNLTDGVDGLATSVTFVVSLFYLVATATLGYFGYNLAAAALIGSLVGFLVWNLHPAKVFMGDTGSMFLGGIVVAFAFAIERPVLLLLAGILYFAEAMSVVIQVAYYKRTKKRLFKMSPIHHHFEMSGWKENKIVVIFSLVALIGCIAAMLFIIFE
ncbi:MAG: phospho-N-acetylmuramoyl-pentapeptide-transferase [Clostridia bacterium]|nr:phospho-N-acetylmuramoyl-pentapeptide-transferase [Clostridia bacterium]